MGKEILGKEIGCQSSEKRYKKGCLKRSFPDFADR